MSEPELYTVDTIAILAYLADKMPPKVDAIFSRAEAEKATLIAPSIIIGEAIYTLLKGREVFGVSVPSEKLILFLDTLEISKSIVLADLDVKGWRMVINIKLPELHDRMVVATYAMHKSKAILTNDEEIAALKGVKAIWQ